MRGAEGKAQHGTGRVAREKTSEQNKAVRIPDKTEEREDGEGGEAFYILNIFCLHFRGTKKETQHHKNTRDVLPQIFFLFKMITSEWKEIYIYPPHLVSTFLLSKHIYHKRRRARSTSKRDGKDEGIYIFSATEANVGVCCIRKQKQIVRRFILSQQQRRLLGAESCLQVCGGETQIMKLHGIKQSHKRGKSKVQLSQTHPLRKIKTGGSE